MNIAGLGSVHLFVGTLPCSDFLKALYVLNRVIKITVKLVLNSLKFDSFCILSKFKCRYRVIDIGLPWAYCKNHGCDGVGARIFEKFSHFGLFEGQVTWSV